MSKLLDININEQLIERLNQFDIKLEKMDDYYFVDGKFPGITAQAFEMERFEDSVIAQIDIHILLPNDSFTESFVGHAVTLDEAIASAFEQFEVNALHTFIMAFWEDAKQVENGVGSDIWEINGSRWQAIISNYSFRGDGSISEVLDNTDSMFEEIEKAIKALPLEKEIYAIRTVYTNVGDGRKVTEALLSNEEFPALEKSISELKWKPMNKFYTVRNLVLLMKLIDEK